MRGAAADGSAGEQGASAGAVPGLGTAAGERCRSHDPRAPFHTRFAALSRRSRSFLTATCRRSPRRRCSSRRGGRSWPPEASADRCTTNYSAYAPATADLTGQARRVPGLSLEIPAFLVLAIKRGEKPPILN